MPLSIAQFPKTILTVVVILVLLSSTVYSFLEMRQLKEEKEQVETELQASQEKVGELEKEATTTRFLLGQAEAELKESQERVQYLEEEAAAAGLKLEEQIKKTQEWQQYSEEVKEWGEQWQQYAETEEAKRAQDIEYDKKRINDINNIGSSLRVYYLNNQAFPDDLLTLEKEGYLLQGVSISDPETGNLYYYERLDGQYALCTKQSSGYYGINIGYCPKDYQY